MDDFIEDLFAFLTVTEEQITCSRCGRLLAEGDQYTLEEDNQVVCSDCVEE
jgi:formylmethanofuran dehydrogenase subunit E